ncbi:MAG: phage portal protein [Bradymonadaceae bacterium]
MGFLSDLRNAWGVLTGQKAVEELGRETAGMVARFQRRQLPAGRGKHGVLKAFHDFPILRACVSRIAWDIADVDWHVRQGEDKSDEHPAIDALQKPNDRQSGVTFRAVTSAYLDTIGEAMWLVLPSTYNASGFEFLTIPPTAARREETGRGEDGNGVQWQIRLGDAHLEVPDSNVVWLKYPNLLNPFGRGHGDAETLADDLAVEEYATEHLESELYNHARPDMQVHISGATGDEIDSVKDRWYSEHGGPQNSGKIMFTGARDPEGEMNAIEFSRSIADTKLLEVRDDEREIVRQTYNIPPEILGDAKDSNRATIDAAFYLYSRGVLKRRLGFLASEMNMHLMPLMPGAGGELEHEKVVPRDKQFQHTVMKTFPSVFEKNEARELADQEPKDELEGEMLPSGGPSGFGPPGAGAQPVGDEGGDDDQADDEDEESDSGTGKVIDLYPRKSIEDDADQVAEQGVEEEELEEIREAAEEAQRRWAARVLEGLGAPTSIESLEPAIQQKVNERYSWVLPDINENTRKQVKSKIIEGFDEGLRPQDIKPDLRDLDGFDDVRAERVSRTEMLSASNSGTHEAHKKAPVDYRSWLSTRDSEVRDAHRELDDKTSSNPIPVEQPFEVDGHTADHPGDFGVAELDIQCRCTTVAEFPEDEDKGLTAEERQIVWEQFDARLEEDEDEMADVVQAAFDRQLEQTIEAFERIIEDAA